MALLLNAGDTVSRSYSYTQPSPLHPSQPQGTGERTGNLFDKSTVVAGYGIDNNSGKLFRSATLSASDYINILGESYIRATYITSGVPNQYGAFYDNNQTFISGYSSYGNAIAVPQNAVYTRITVKTEYIDEFMLNAGSTAPTSYIPYGYKIPISSANTTTPIYLGEVQTTRKIRKLVLTGNESYTYQSEYSRHVFHVLDAFAEGTRKTQCFCSHYQSVHNGEPITDVPNNSIYINQQLTGTQFCIKDELITSADDFKSYLAAQYAAGTPVTVWYVLATETTGIVNEPLMKIGDYADTLSNVSIPVTAGGDTLSVGTTVQPSETTVNYKGWHPVADVHERNSGAWT